MNPFERYATDHKSAYERRRESIANKRRVTLLRKKEDERRQLEHRYRDSIKEFVADFAERAGERGRRLLAFLDGLTIHDREALLDAACGFRTCNAMLRRDALHLMNRAMIGAREDAALPPFDDPLWDRKSVFDLIKLELVGDEP